MTDISRTPQMATGPSRLTAVLLSPIIGNMKLRFHEISEKVPETPGIYEIYTNDGVALKVGIASNLRQRLRQHARSRQISLKFAHDQSDLSPGDVRSKQSILAKHLYFDSSISTECDLKSEKGRQKFLNEFCCLIISETDTREEARRIERQKEAMGGYRYVGRVTKR